MPRLAQLACAALVLATPALAQQNQIPDLPRTEEIVAKTKEVLDGSPDEVVEVPGVAKLTYKRLPLDVHAVALLYGATLDGTFKPREPLERYVRQFEARIAPVIDEKLGDVGELEVLVPLSAKGKAIPVGKYRVGVALESGRPAAVLLRSADPKAKPIVVKLKARRPEGEPEKDGALRLRLVEPPAKDPPPKKPEPRGVDLSVNARNQEAAARVIMVEAGADEGADEADEKK